jgi:Co/Zn/Cd efflux system component
MGIVGAFFIARWAILLLRDYASIIKDNQKESPLSHKIREHIESDGNARISDLHLLKVADEKFACIVSICN